MALESARLQVEFGCFVSDARPDSRQVCRDSSKVGRSSSGGE